MSQQRAADDLAQQIENRKILADIEKEEARLKKQRIDDENAQIIENQKILDAAIKKREENEQRFIKSVRTALATAAELTEVFLQRNIDMIDKQIEKQEGLFDESKKREDELRAIAKERGLDATESINAEREAQKASLKAQQDLERKRQRAEALIAGLRILAAKIEQGQGNPVGGIKTQLSDIKSFVEGNFYEGTPYTFADALGYSPGRDSHVVAVDNDESVFTGKQTSDLNIGKGGNSTQDIVDLYKKSFKQETDVLKQINVVNPEVKADKKMLNKMDELISVQKKMDPAAAIFNSMSGMLEYRNQVTGDKYSYPVRKK